MLRVFITSLDYDIDNVITRVTFSLHLLVETVRDLAHGADLELELLTLTVGSKLSTVP